MYISFGVLKKVPSEHLQSSSEITQELNLVPQGHEGESQEKTEGPSKVSHQRGERISYRIFSMYQKIQRLYI